MIRHAVEIAEGVALLGAVASIAYYFLCLASAFHFLSSAAQKSDGASSLAHLPVSILKPLKGNDPEMYENLRSHCQLQYPEYEIVFGVSDIEDPALVSVERLRKEFPQRAIRWVLCPKTLGANLKVSNLAQMVPQASYECLLVNDSDIRVPSDYLQMVINPLTDPEIGLVTCLYRGRARSTLGSRLEALGISTDFAAGVLTARALEGGIRFGLGSTLAFRRRELCAIGGFEALADYLADDYELGSRIAQLGLKVKLSEVIVDTCLPPYSLSEFFLHQLRWSRAIRDSRPAGYWGLVLTFGLPWALLAVLVSKGAGWAWVLLGATGLARLLTALVVGRGVLEDRQTTRWMLLIPLRDLLAVPIWIASLAGNRVTWRGMRFRLRRGKLEPDPS
jgi:ceramide glucosyltransferase